MVNGPVTISIRFLENFGAARNGAGIRAPISKIQFKF